MCLKSTFNCIFFSNFKFMDRMRYDCCIHSFIEFLAIVFDGFFVKCSAVEKWFVFFYRIHITCTIHTLIFRYEIDNINPEVFRLWRHFPPADTRQSLFLIISSTLKHCTVCHGRDTTIDSL